MCLYQINGLFIVYRPSVSANMLYVFQIPFHTLLPMNSTFENSGRGVKEKLNFLFNEECIEEKSC